MSDGYSMFYSVSRENGPTPEKFKIREEEMDEPEELSAKDLETIIFEKGDIVLLFDRDLKRYLTCEKDITIKEYFERLKKIVDEEMTEKEY